MFGVGGVVVHFDDHIGDGEVIGSDNGADEVFGWIEECVYGFAFGFGFDAYVVENASCELAAIGWNKEEVIDARIEGKCVPAIVLREFGFVACGGDDVEGIACDGHVEWLSPNGFDLGLGDGFGAVSGLSFFADFPGDRRLLLEADL